MNKKLLFANVGWLAPVAGDSLKASCTYCSCILRAHYSDLQLHSKTAKHQRNAKSAAVGDWQPPLLCGSESAAIQRSAYLYCIFM